MRIINTEREGGVGTRPSIDDTIRTGMLRCVISTIAAVLLSTLAIAEVTADRPEVETGQVLGHSLKLQKDLNEINELLDKVDIEHRTAVEEAYLAGKQQGRFEASIQWISKL